MSLSAAAKAAIQRRLAEVEAAKSRPPSVNTQGPAVNQSQKEVNKTVAAVNKRGAYPNTDARRIYMRDLMRTRRAAERAEDTIPAPKPPEGQS